MKNPREYILKEIKIEGTYKCPLACIHCSSDAMPSNSQEIDQNKCIEIINQAIELGVKEITISGGEPLLWPALDKVVNLISQNNAKSVLYTTGISSTTPTILKKLKTAGLNKIVFSIFGSDDISHERITRKRGSFADTINAIKSSIELGITTEFHFVALAKNYFQLPEIIKLANNIGIQRTSVLRFVPQGRGATIRNEVLNKMQAISLKREIESLRSDGNAIRTGSPFNILLLNDNPNCKAGIDRLIIGPDLRIYPCDAFKQIKAEEIVNTLDFSSLDKYTLEECWINSPYLQRIREYIGSEADEPCKFCENLAKCLSGCAAQKVIYYGSLVKKPDPLCLKQ